jgi:hypothetical protein
MRRYDRELRGIIFARLREPGPSFHTARVLEKITQRVTLSILGADCPVSGGCIMSRCWQRRVDISTENQAMPAAATGLRDGLETAQCANLAIGGLLGLCSQTRPIAESKIWQCGSDEGAAVGCSHAAEYQARWLTSALRLATSSLNMLLAAQSFTLTLAI